MHPSELWKSLQVVGVLQGVVSGFAGSRLIAFSAGLRGNFRLFKHTSFKM